MISRKLDLGSKIVFAIIGVAIDLKQFAQCNKLTSTEYNALCNLLLQMKLLAKCQLSKDKKSFLLI